MDIPLCGTRKIFHCVVPKNHKHISLCSTRKIKKQVHLKEMTDIIIEQENTCLVTSILGTLFGHGYTLEKMQFYFGIVPIGVHEHSGLVCVHSVEV